MHHFCLKPIQDINKLMCQLLGERAFAKLFCRRCVIKEDGKSAKWHLTHGALLACLCKKICFWDAVPFLTVALLIQFIKLPLALKTLLYDLSRYK